MDYDYNMHPVTVTIHPNRIVLIKFTKDYASDGADRWPYWYGELNNPTHDGRITIQGKCNYARTAQFDCQAKPFGSFIFASVPGMTLDIAENPVNQDKDQLGIIAGYDSVLGWLKPHNEHPKIM
jgi:hypothetical protein